MPLSNDDFRSSALSAQSVRLLGSPIAVCSAFTFRQIELSAAAYAVLSFAYALLREDPPQPAVTSTIAATAASVAPRMKRFCMTSFRGGIEWEPRVALGAAKRLCIYGDRRSRRHNDLERRLRPCAAVGVRRAGNASRGAREPETVVGAGTRPPRARAPRRRVGRV